MKFLEELVQYYRQQQLQSIYILGCSEQLRVFQPEHVSPKDLVIGLNSSFLLFPIDILFFACKKFYLNYKEKLEKYLLAYPKQKVVRAGIASLPSLSIVNEYVYRGVKTTDATGNTLMLGHSVLIPALSLACLLFPQRIFLYGIDLNYNQHWNDNKKMERGYKTFPARISICQEVKRVQAKFKTMKIYCTNRESLLCVYGIIPWIAHQKIIENSYLNC